MTIKSLFAHHAIELAKEWVSPDLMQYHLKKARTEESALKSTEAPYSNFTLMRFVKSFGNFLGTEFLRELGAGFIESIYRNPKYDAVIPISLLLKRMSAKNTRCS